MEQRYLTEKPFTIIPCDKNIGFALLEKNFYKELAHGHLMNNGITYKKLDENPLKSTIKAINNELKSLVK